MRLVVTVFLLTAPFVFAQSPVDAALATQSGDIFWYDVSLLPMEGRAYEDRHHAYDRLPARAKEVVEPGVWSLSEDSAGMVVRFVTNANTFKARWSLRGSQLSMAHMPATGVSGLDLYIRDGDEFRWAGVGRPSRQNGAEDSFVLFPTNEPREYMLYLPLYNGVESLEIGIEKDEFIAPAPERPSDKRKPIVFYGTSITQGACASRAGATHSAILGRWLDRPIVNLGFSGMGKMFPEFVGLLADIDAACYVIDCGPNMGPDLMQERATDFLTNLRAAKPNTPIVVVESMYPRQAAYHTSRQDYPYRNAILRKAYEGLANHGEPWHYIKGDDLYGHDGEGTVDGVHATDLGFMRMAEEFLPVLREALAP